MATYYDFGNSPEELQEAIWNLSVKIADLEKKVVTLETRTKSIRHHSNGKTNNDIRAALFEARMTQGDLADLLGVSESTLYRMFRKELPEKEQKRIVWIIENRDKYAEIAGRQL